MAFGNQALRSLQIVAFLIQGGTSAFSLLVPGSSTILRLGPSTNVFANTAQHSAQLRDRTPHNRRITTSSRTNTRRFATWSNGQAVQDYQNFLSSGRQQVALTDDGPSVIVQPPLGSSLLGETLAQMGLGDDVVLTPQQELPDQVAGRSEYPVYITLPPYQLSDFLANLPESYQARVDDLVFFSGGLEYGNIEDVLKDRGYCRDSMTQVLISGLRVEPATKQIRDVKAFLGVDASGVDKLAGECAATGKWAGSMARRLERSNVFCRTDFYREWRRRMWERTVFDAVFHLIGAIRDQPTTLQDVANYYVEEVGDIAWEMSQKLRGWRAITLMYGFEERLLGIGESAGAEQPCQLVHEMYPYIWGTSVMLESQAFVEYLKYAQNEKGLLPGIELPMRSDSDYSSKMLQGNLRADGVI